MKILLVIDRLGIGGAESHLLQLAEGLVRLGDEVVIASGGGALADTTPPFFFTFKSLVLGNNSVML